MRYKKRIQKHGQIHFYMSYGIISKLPTSYNAYKIIENRDFI